MNENRTDDEKTGSIQISTKNGPYTTNSEADTTRYIAGEIMAKPSLEGSLNGSRIPVEETFRVVAAPTAQSAAAVRMEGLFLNLEGDEGSLRNEARYLCLSVRPSVRPSFRLPVCLSVSQSVSVSVFVCVSVCLSVCLTCLIVSLSACLPTHRSICPLFCLPLYLSFCLFAVLYSLISLVSFV